MSRTLPIGLALVRTAHRCLSLPNSSQRLQVVSVAQRRFMAGGKGSGEGKGGGGGGAVRSAGGGMGKKQAAQEDRYFRDEETKQIQNMKQNMGDMLKDKLKIHEQNIASYNGHIKRHQDELAQDQNHSYHDGPIKEFEEAVRREEEAIKKIQDMWKRLQL